MVYTKPDLWRPVGVDSLERAAEDVIISTHNALVVAGPGAGKTELLAQRASFLLDTATCIPSRRILAISFKRDAAKNLAERVQKRCGERAKRFDSFTLDSFAKGLVDRFRLALSQNWRPGSGYQPMTKKIKIEEIQEWLIRAGVSKNTLDNMPDLVIERQFDQICHGYPLPYSGDDVSQRHRDLGLRWWQEQLSLSIERPSLSFPMLNRLAAYLLRENPKLATALRATYSHVFLDEFQDTTASQFDLIRTAFKDSDIILTAVGDSKQRIMLWAGAMDKAFENFETDFSARRHHLISNYRSAPELVRMQQIIAEALESDTPTVSAAKIDSTGSCQILEFNTSSDEADYLASMINHRIANGEQKQRNFCVIVRQGTSGMIKALQASLSNFGLKLRDESQLQDVFTEPAANFLIAILRIATRTRDPKAWDLITNELPLLVGIDEEDSIKISRESKRLVTHTRNKLNDGLPIKDVISQIVSMVGADSFRVAYRQYNDRTHFDYVITALTSALENSIAQSQSIRDAVDDLIGLNAIPAITIHKSKGLEFNTVIFLGLEDSQWWGFAKEPEEEKRSFFVAFSRAIEHVYFTYSDVRDNGKGMRVQEKSKIGDLYSILQKAGVETLNCRNGSSDE